jgi:hypothetical protein
MNRWIRQLHRFLGVFFAPMLLLYIATGWWQTVTVNRNKGLGFGRSWIERLSTIHIDQYFPWGMRDYSTYLYKGLVIAMSVGLIITTLLGLVMGFRFGKSKITMILTLAAGILVPILLLYLGEGAKKQMHPPAPPEHADNAGR